MALGQEVGTLYLCGTPIGNLEDITLRVLRILREVDLIAAEDTRHTKKLLNHYQINTPLISYHEHNRQARGPQLIQRLQQGEDIALVTDAGMPGIADPGEDLARQVMEEGLSLVAVPGPTALITALVVSGQPTDGFIFAGFPPRKKKEREEFFRPLTWEQRTVVFYEAPHRLLETLADLEQWVGERMVVVTRELTKVYEEVRRGTAAQHRAHFQEHQPRGEFCLVVAPAAVNQDSGIPGEKLAGAVALVEELVEVGVPKKAAIALAAREKGLSKRDVYQAVVGEK